MRYTVRPISDRTWLGRTKKETSRFEASWNATLSLLGHEVAALRGRDLVIECDISERDLKLNGELRANARPSTPAVVVAFESRVGPLLYRCDKFTSPRYDAGPSWQHNVRAIAKTLEALRAVERYGASETGQQYTGYKALPAGSSPIFTMTRDEAYDALYTLLGLTNSDAVASDADLIKRARRRYHPDHNDGDTQAWDQIDMAAQVLGVK